MIGQNWYAQNGMRRYPLDDAATATTDDGRPVPTGLLTDAHIRFPSDYATYAFISGVTITERLVTIVLAAADDTHVETEFKPLASLTLLRAAVVSDRQYAIVPAAPGVGGFVVFGQLPDAWSGRFSTPAQSRMSLRSVRGYKAIPVSSLKKKGRATALAGVVSLRAGNNIAIVKEELDVDGEIRQAAVIRLKQELTGRNVYAEYVGPCGKRPESGNCDRDTAETINNVTPDCNGNITLSFTGLTTAVLDVCNGLVLEHNVNLSDVCEATRSPDFTGNDLCGSDGSETSSSSVPSSASSESSPGSETSSEVPPTCGELPFCTSFDSGGYGFFEAVSGGFAFVESDTPDEFCPGVITSSSDTVVFPYSSSSASSIDVVQYVDPVVRSYKSTNGGIRNVSVWDACAYESSLNKRVITDIRITAEAAQRNGGIVINYHWVDLLDNPHIEYLHVVLDQLQQQLQLRWFSGLATTSTLHVVPLSGAAQIGHWYRLTVEVTEHPSDNSLAVIGARVSGVTNPAWPSVAFTLSTSRFMPADGLYGVGADRSRTEFGQWQIEEMP